MNLFRSEKELPAGSAELQKHEYSMYHALAMEKQDYDGPAMLALLGMNVAFFSNAGQSLRHDRRTGANDSQTVHLTWLIGRHPEP